MSELRDIRCLVVVRCLHCRHEGSLSGPALAGFGLDPEAPIAAYVKRLRCSNCGSSSVMAKRTTKPDTLDKTAESAALRGMRFATPISRGRRGFSIAEQASPKVIHMSEPVRAQAMRSSAAATRKPLSVSSP
jgi:hypothetical protein